MLTCMHDDECTRARVRTKTSLTNISKTKIIIFSRGKVRKFKSFLFNDGILEVVDNYHVGVVFNYNNKFKKAQNNQIGKAKRAMYSLMIKSKITGGTW